MEGTAVVGSNKGQWRVDALAGGHRCQTKFSPAPTATLNKWEVFPVHVGLRRTRSDQQVAKESAFRCQQPAASDVQGAAHLQWPAPPGLHL